MLSYNDQLLYMITAHIALLLHELMGQLYLCGHELPRQLYGPAKKDKHIYTHQYQ